MKDFLRFILCLIITFITMAATGQTMDLANDNYVSFLVFLVIVFIHLKIDKGRASKKILADYIISFVVLNVAVRFMEGWANGLVGVPNNLFILLGIISGYILFTGTTAKRFILPTLFFALALCQAFIFHPYWLNYVNFKNFTGKTNEHKGGYDWKFYNSNGDTVSKANYKDKIVLLDFWNTSCGVCFTKFPILEKLYGKYKDNPKVIVQAVNIPIERDTGRMAFNIIEKKNYTFPVLIGLNNADSVFGIESYPTTLVLYNDEIVYRGYIEKSENTVDELLSKK
jgi:thiol-disulfide isomerase/thioredoxin